MKQISVMIIVLCMLLIGGQVVADGWCYGPPKRKLDERSQSWRKNVVGILRFENNYKNPLIVREGPGKETKRILSCLKIADCGFNFVNVGGYGWVQNARKPFSIEKPDEEMLLDIVVKEIKGNWYKVLYHSNWNLDGWIYFEKEKEYGSVTILKGGASYISIEKFFEYAMGVAFLNDPERNDLFLIVKKEPDENSETLLEVPHNDNLLLKHENRIQGDWVRVDYGSDCTADFDRYLLNEGGKVGPDYKECQWGWVRWRAKDGLILMWPFSYQVL